MCELPECDHPTGLLCKLQAILPDFHVALELKAGVLVI